MIRFVLENHRIPNKWVKNFLLHIQNRSNSNYPMVKEKRNGLTFPEFSVKICWFLQLSPPYWKWSQHNAMQSECTKHLPQNHPEINALWKHIIYEIFSEQGDWTRQVWKNVLKSHFFPLASSWNKTSKILAITFIS